PEIAERLAAESEEPELNVKASQTPEPDMYSTRDIETLYTQSFAETVEMPHTVAERARFSDGSADDELIETTYSEPQQTAEAQSHFLEMSAQLPGLGEKYEAPISEPVAGEEGGPHVQTKEREPAKSTVAVEPAGGLFEDPPQPDFLPREEQTEFEMQTA